MLAPYFLMGLNFNDIFFKKYNILVVSCSAVSLWPKKVYTIYILLSGSASA